MSRPTLYKGTLPEFWQRSNLQYYMDKFHKVFVALSFAGVSISDERKVLIFICGLSLPEDSYNLDEVYEALIYLRQSKVLEGSMTSNRKGRGD
jgi:hypothetical protein